MPLLPGRRKKARPDDEELPGETASEQAGESEAEVELPEGAEVVADAGERRRPLDESEAGETDELRRLDLGSLRIPVLADMEVRVELNEQRQPVAATLLHAGSAVQILAFAAPRHDGIWDDVRAEIAESVREGGGQAEEAHGVFGIELRARVRGQAGQGQPVEQHLRFVGFDGPRWFLRGVFSGPAATNPQQAVSLETVLTHVVVARGQEPMAPRDPLPLRLPTDVAGAAAAPAEQQRPTLDPFTRGPEITEIQ